MTRSIAEARAYVQSLEPQALNRAEARSMQLFAVGKMLGILGDDWPGTYPDLDEDRRCLLAYYDCCIREPVASA